MCNTKYHEINSSTASYCVKCKLLHNAVVHLHGFKRLFSQHGRKKAQVKVITLQKDCVPGIVRAGSASGTLDGTEPSLTQCVPPALLQEPPTGLVKQGVYQGVRAERKELAAGIESNIQQGERQTSTEEAVEITQ